MKIKEERCLSDVRKGKPSNLRTRMFKSSQAKPKNGTWPHNVIMLEKYD